MIAKILWEAQEFRNRVKSLKERSPLFPHILFDTDENGHIWASTLVKYNYEGANYLRHHCETIVPTATVGITELHRKLIDGCEKTLAFGVPFGDFDEKVK